jgi:membrane peptidoglycan carboxypeptidase
MMLSARSRSADRGERSITRSRTAAAPLRAVRSVIADDGELLQRYEIQITQSSDPAHVYALNQALVQAMERGTGRNVRHQLPADLVVAGKTGTSDDLRDSWFAGFSNDHLIVTWLGADDNRPIGSRAPPAPRRFGPACSRAYAGTPTTHPHRLRSTAAGSTT